MGSRQMNRRHFIRVSGCASASLFCRSSLFAEEVPIVSVHLSLRRDRVGNRIREDFTGLSYESAQLGNPQFFSGDNTELAGFVRRLGRSGVLRIGGNTSEYCYWRADLNDGKSAKANDNASTSHTGVMGTSSSVGPDTGLKVPPRVNIEPLAIRNLRDFLDATGWKLIYGLNMGTGTLEDAAAEAAYVNDVIGSKLVAFQLCNEPDLFYHNGIREPGYNFEQFSSEWVHFSHAIRATVPDAPFAGPDTAFNNDWMIPFAKRFKNEVRFVSQHYYAEGPPTDPSMTLERLLRPDTKLQDEFEGMKQVTRESGLPFRLSETNSCYSGGKPGVSDTFASALWGGDLMYQLASEGGIGINFHGGGYGWYSPIAGTRESGFLARPIYYAMLLFAQAGSGQLFECKLNGHEQAPLLTAYGLSSDDQNLKIAVFNKNLDRRVRLEIDAGKRVEAASLQRLFAPRVDDTTDVTFGGAPVGASGSWSAGHDEGLSVQHAHIIAEVPATSAALITVTTE
jgi:Glycosyl hydrolase family 79, N-terminal domain